MPGETDKLEDAAHKSDTPDSSDNESKEVPTKRKQGLVSRIWHGVMSPREDDFQGRLEKISKEEAITVARMGKRIYSFRRTKMNLIVLTLSLEVAAVGYAIITTRSVENWKKRALCVFPMFAWPGVMSAVYLSYVSCVSMCERRDQRTLERLQAERQSQIDELKEKTNFYITQQLIERYDTDPAAKAAAAAVLASKLGSDLGFKVQFGDDSKLHVASGNNSDAESVQSEGLRKRKASRSNRSRSPISEHYPDAMAWQEMENDEIDEHSQPPTYVDNYEPGERGSTSYGGGGWLDRLITLIVGQDPTQCYALICGNCHMHNGLASKEDFPYYTYICPHCQAVNGPRLKDTVHASSSSTPKMISVSPRPEIGRSLSNISQVSNISQPPVEETPVNRIVGDERQEDPAPVAEEESKQKQDTR